MMNKNMSLKRFWIEDIEKNVDNTKLNEQGTQWSIMNELQKKTWMGWRCYNENIMRSLRWCASKEKT